MKLVKIILLITVCVMSSFLVNSYAMDKIGVTQPQEAPIADTPGKPVSDVLKQNEAVENNIAIKNSITEYVDDSGKKIVNITAGPGGITIDQPITADEINITGGDVILKDSGSLTLIDSKSTLTIDSGSLSLTAFNYFTPITGELIIFPGNLKPGDSNTAPQASVTMQTDTASLSIIQTGTFILNRPITPEVGATFFMQATSTVVEKDPSQESAKKSEELMALKRAKEYRDKMKSHFDEPNIVRAPSRRSDLTYGITQSRHSPYNGNGATMGLQTAAEESEE